MKYTIDAKGKKLGRVASEAAALLMAKNSPDFVRNKAPKVQVHVINTAQAAIDPKKKEEKIYVTYTGHPGGLYKKKMATVIKEKGHVEIFRQAIYGMLPHNKLTNQMMKNVVITE